jgi:hypothetical protein
MSEEEKYVLGKERAEQHNKLLRYMETRRENEIILSKFLNYLNEKEIEVVLINFPTSKYYSKFLNKKFKADYYSIIKKYKNKITFIDLDTIAFEDQDFRDFDHINDIGAAKISCILNDFFESKKES